MRTPVTPLRHIRGTTFLLHVYCKSTASTAPGQALDITAATVEFAIAEWVGEATMVTLVGNADATIAKTVHNGVVSKLEIEVPGSIFDGGPAARLPKREYWVQVNITLAGKEWCVFRGPLELEVAPVM